MNMFGDFQMELVIEMMHFNLPWAIEAMYKGTRAKVVTPDGISMEFKILAGGHS